MIFQANEYYVCVGDYILNKEEARQREKNQFLECMRMIEESDRRKGYYSTRPATSWDYEWYNDEYEGPTYGHRVEVPCFSIGCIYRCNVGGTLVDSEGKAIQISDENVDNFVHLEFRIDHITKDFIKKVDGSSLKIVVKPTSFMNVDKNTLKETKDISNLTLWFEVQTYGAAGWFNSIWVYENEISIRNAVYSIWKKCRVKSKQCTKIQSCIHKKKWYGSTYVFKPYSPVNIL